MSDQSGEGYSLVVSFPDQSASFVHGFECGMIWQAMKDRTAISMTVHNANAECLQRMARHHGYSCVLERYDDTWSTATLTQAGKPRPKLEIVK